MESKKNRTPKEQYDDEMKQINKDIKAANEKNEDDVELNELANEANQELEEEAIVDKSMGDVKEPVGKSTMVNDEFQELKKKKAKIEALKKMTCVGGLMKEKLSPQQQETMQKALKLFENGKIKDPVLKHLIESKIEHAQSHASLTVELRNLQLEIKQKMQEITIRVADSMGAANLYNKDIIRFIQKNPKLVESGSQSNA